MARDPLRVLVALDARPESLHALERSVALAADLGAEITGLFIEDERLLRLCELPVLEVRLHGGPRHPEAASLRRELRARAAKARLALEREATRMHLAWTFRVARGRIEEEVLGAGPGTHVVAPSRAVRRGAGRRRPAIGALVDDGGDDRALGLAARIAANSTSPLLVIAPQAALAAPEDLRQRIESVIGTRSPTTVAGYGTGSAALAERVRSLALDVLVARATAFTPAALGRLCAAADCDLVFLGDADPAA